jgi:hypothetical protein
MRNDERKAAIAAYKERKTIGGVYVVRCTASGELWVGQCPNLDGIQNRVWFTLRLGTDPNQSLQTAWRQHGAEHFQFEVLEQTDEDEPNYVNPALLTERAAQLRLALKANRL